MANDKQNMNKHLDSAKEWVSRAQESFEKEKDIRGELDLILAQAELTHAKKKSRLYRIIKYPLFKEGMAVTAALFLVAFGLGFGYFSNAQLPKEQSLLTASSENTPKEYSETIKNDIIPNEAQPKLLAEPDKILSDEDKQAKELKEIASPSPNVSSEIISEPLIVVTAAQIEPQERREPSYNPAPVSVSREQMQDLIRSAGTFLRGRD